MEKFQDYVAGREKILLAYLNYTFSISNLLNLNTEYLNFSKFYN